MKKKLFAFVGALMLSVGMTANAATDIKIKIDGEVLECDPSAEVVNDRVLVPMRVIFEKLGAYVYWDSEKRLISAEKDDFFMFMQVENPKMFLNVGKEKKEVDLPAAPIIVEERALVPIRAVSESFGIQVNWNDKLREVEINL